MKRLIYLILAATLFVLVAWTRYVRQTAITGKITPIDGANMVWAISGRDSATSNIVNGIFSLAVKPGLYKVTVDALEPYKDAVLENISIKADETVDVGEIVLQK